MSNTAFVSIGDLKRGRQALSPVAQILETAASGGCSTSGGEGEASWGSSGGLDDMSVESWEQVKKRPCYSERAHHHCARMQLAVAPACR